MSEHTPLPWKAVPNFRGTGYYIDEPAHNRRIALVNEKDAGIERDECQANAEYIVRACNAHYDLVAACEEALNEFKHLGQALGELTQPEMVDCMNKIEAALGKSTQ